MRARRAGVLCAFALVLANVASVCAQGAADVAADTNSLESAVQAHLGVFLTTPALRDAAEGLRIQRDALEIWFLRPIEPKKRDAALCDGFRWLLLGRLAETHGVGALFAARSDLERVTLVFYDVETHVAPDRDGRYVQKRTPAPQARFTIGRGTAANLDPKVLEGTLRGPRCVTLGKSLVDLFWMKP
ncbi:MAG: hypothetical protein KC620_00560 [Myxococcales bacterium]|nr:hypothetical protein [Myxococcales bacterium]